MATGTGLAVIALTLAACSSGAKSTTSSSSGTTGSTPASAPSSGGGASAPTGSGGTTLPAASGSFSFLGLSDNQTAAQTLQSMAGAACSSANQTSKLSPDNLPQAQLDQKLQLLVGQNALPNMFIAPGTPALATQFIQANKLQDVSMRLAAAGVSDDVLPAAASVIQQLYGQKDLYALPNEMNIEGIWYNKKIFADNNITVPTTWDDLVADMKKLKDAGVQPVTADGKDGWDVTRWVGMYLFRSVGPDALQKVADGQA
jgi:raffinose/stachyose/melibiose transport system substrate-binding protein